MDSQLAGEKVLITSVAGIHGFVGGRLVEKLGTNTGIKIRALLRDFNEAPRIARFPVEMVRVDLADTVSVRNAVQDCSIVFSTDHDFQRLERNITATRVLAEACLAGGVKRIVHMSSAGTYEPFRDGIVNEQSPKEVCAVGWVKSKRAVEAEFMRYHDQFGLPVVVIQPTHIYGPWAYNGTIRPASQMRNGKIVLPNSAGGLCNTVYVDDVAEAMTLAATTKGVEGERFLISGPGPITWREFYNAYERILGVDGVVLRPADEIWRGGIRQRLAILRQSAFKLRNVFPLKQLKDRFSAKQQTALINLAGRRLPTNLYYPDRLALRLYLAQARVSFDKASQMLGYEPRFDFERGMDFTAQYLRWSRLA